MSEKNISKLAEIGEEIIMFNLKRSLRAIKDIDRSIEIETNGPKIIVQGQENKGSFDLHKAKGEININKIDYRIHSEYAERANLNISELKEKYKEIMEKYNLN